MSDNETNAEPGWRINEENELRSPFNACLLKSHCIQRADEIARLRAENGQLKEDLYNMTHTTSIETADWLAEAERRLSRLEEILETHDCPIHGRGDGKDCPRC